MNDQIYSISAASPEGLAYKLSELSDDEKSRYRFISLAISGPEVLVQPFNIPGIKVKDIKERLKMVSVELLNLPADQVAFDFQILSATDERVCGLFACAPQSLMDEYMSVVKHTKLQIIKMTAYILASIDAFYQQNEAFTQRFCLLDFTREGYINLAVIHEQRFELLRKVPYENYEEALFEIKQSLRSACAKSSVKQFDHIYFSGTIPEQQRLITEIEQDFNTKTLYKDDHCIKKSFISPESYFSINLVRNASVSLAERKYISLAFQILIGMAVMVCCAGVFRIHSTDRKIQSLSTQGEEATFSYVKTEYKNNPSGVL
ncbi:MAG: hypothetical protein AB7S78_13870 [Candidatus Omnitrophota bacterium]